MALLSPTDVGFMFSLCQDVKLRGLNRQWPLQDEPQFSKLRTLCGHIGEAAAAIPHLTQDLRDSHDRGRISAADALGAMGQDAPKLLKQFLRQLRDALKDSHAGVRKAAARALGAIGQKVPNEVVPQIKVALRLHSSREAAAVALRAIVRKHPNFSNQVIQHFLKGLEGGSNKLRQEAAGALGAIGQQIPTRVWPQLTKALRSGSSRSRKGAVVAFQVMGQAARAAKPELYRAAGHRKSDVRVAAARALRAIGVNIYLADAGAANCPGEGKTPRDQHGCDAAADVIYVEKQKTPKRGLQVGDGGGCEGHDRGWGAVPIGCSVQSRGDWAAHLKLSGVDCPDPAYQLVCVEEE